MEDTVNEQLPDELTPEQDDIQTATLQFKFKTYLFSGPDKADEDGANIISKLSTWISTWVEISDGVSVEMSAEVSSMIDVVYDGFVPQILAISAGFYPVPYVRDDMVEYTNEVDGYPNPNPFVDRLIWKIDNASDAAFPENVAQYNGNIYPDEQ